MLRKVFNVTDPEVAVVVFPRPIVASTLHFHIRDYFSWPCWTLAPFGCTFSEGKLDKCCIHLHNVIIIPENYYLPCNSINIILLPAKVEHSVMMTSVAPNPTPSPPPLLPPQSPPQTDPGLGIALSTAAGIVIASAVLVGIGVALCWAIHNGFLYVHAHILVIRSLYFNNSYSCRFSRPKIITKRYHQWLTQ